MPTQNGLTYVHNYDVIVKWFAEALRGETLDVLGIPTGRIAEVFGCEPAEIQVNLDRVDVMLRDEAGALFHLEEQRNLQRADLYRCAAYHFQVAQRWTPDVTDIILASGAVMAGPPRLATCSGTYTPIVIDFTARDGVQRFQEIRAAVAAGTFTQWLELLFLPLYGTVTGAARSAFIEQVVRFEKELYRADKISNRLLAATLIMSNKLIAKERLYALWEEVKMLDIIEIAMEKGMAQGKTLGLQEGKTLGLQEGKTLGILEDRRELVLDGLMERFPTIPTRIFERIRALQNPDTLKFLHRQAFRCQTVQEFEAIMASAEVA